MLDINNIYEDKPSKITKMIWWISGANIKLLSKLPSVKVKYQVIGILVLITAIFATITSSYALNFVYGNIYIAIGFGLFWGGVILNIDRFLIISINKQASFSKQIIIALPRLLIAIFIALLVAKPFELAIFEKEINSQYKYIVEQKKGFENSIVSRNNALKSLLEEQKRHTEERLGHLSTGSGKLGNGPISESIREEVDIRKKISDASISDTDFYKKEIGKYISILGMVEDSELGVLARLALLNSLKSNNTVYYIDIFLSLLFILLEILPILTKLLLPKDSYDDALEELIALEKNTIKSDILELISGQDDFSKEKIKNEKIFISELYGKLSLARNEKTEEVFSKWKEDKKASFIDLLDSLSYQFGQQDFEEIGKIEVKKPSFKFKYPTLHNTVKYPVVTGILSGILWLFIKYAASGSLPREGLKFTLIIIALVTLVSWLLYNLEQRIKEKVKNRVGNATIDSITGAVVMFFGYVILSFVAKLSFGVDVENMQQFVDVALYSGVGKYAADRILT